MPTAALAAVTMLYSFPRGMWSAARACDNQTAEEAGKGILVPDQCFGWSLLFQWLAVKKEEMLSPLSLSTSSSGLYYFSAAVLTPNTSLEGVVFSKFLSLLEEV